MGYAKIVLGFLIILFVDIPREEPIAGLLVFLLLLWAMISGVEDLIEESKNKIDTK